MIRVATFNVENLFARYRFRRNIDPVGLEGFTINELAFDIYDETSKQITGKTIKEVNADILALQEVENLLVLDRFNSRYLAGMKYRHRMLIDAFDPRRIDVAVLSRYPIVKVRSYRQERNRDSTGWLFSRDCLEVDIDVDGKLLTLYVNHFKSMIGGRQQTKKRREEQVKKVAELVTERWGDDNYQRNFIVSGDFNDYVDNKTSLDALLNHEGLVHVSKRISDNERWTHYWSGGNEYRQLDYLLLSKSLAEANNRKPQILRKGLPYRAERYDGERFELVGENYPKASDHCPIYMDIELA